MIKFIYVSNNSHKKSVYFSEQFCTIKKTFEKYANETIEVTEFNNEYKCKLIKLS